VAAQLGTDKSLEVTREKGSFGELQILVDDVEVIDYNPIHYPSPSTVTARVREHLEATSAR